TESSVLSCENRGACRIPRRAKEKILRLDEFRAALHELCSGNSRVVLFVEEERHSYNTVVLGRGTSRSEFWLKSRLCGRQQTHDSGDCEVATQRDEASIQAHDGIMFAEHEKYHDDDASHHPGEDPGHGSSL